MWYQPRDTKGLEILRHELGWTLYFNEATGGTESTIIVSCNAEGERCRVDIAG